MTKVTAVDQFEKLITVAKETFAKDRFKKLEKMYEQFADRILVAPASGKVHYHNCYPGGYLDHIHNVITATVEVARTMKKMGVTMDFTKEEAIFAAMHHDLGKLGDLEQPYYLPQTSDWHRTNRGEYYTHNPDLVYMSVTDRALYLLQHFDMDVTAKEWKAIKVSDGLYDDSNKAYYISYQYPPQPFHTNLHYVIHFADHISTIGERDRQRMGTSDAE